jgi:hypothetical protein
MTRVYHLLQDLGYRLPRRFTYRDAAWYQVVPAGIGILEMRERLVDTTCLGRWLGLPGLIQREIKPAAPLKTITIKFNVEDFKET